MQPSAEEAIPPCETFLVAAPNYKVDVRVANGTLEEFTKIATGHEFNLKHFDTIGAGNEGGREWMLWVHAGGFTATATALSVVIRTYITRRRNNSVTLWKDGKKIAEIKGEMSADDIVKILGQRRTPEP
ncbi:hypothetical protein ACIF83_30055 [Streptomyces sp. NPDC085866]|uniref:hypothetical protein n=1 Tax=Streptomyces sp. NPDC085866 TaxID=3365736 RepID=UPI0037D3D14F